MTVRYGEPRSFNMFMARAVKPGGCRPPAGGGARRADRDHHRPRRGDPGHCRQRASTACRRRSSRTRGSGTRRAAPIRAALQAPRPQGRHHLQRAREHGVGGAHAAVPLRQHAAAAEDGRLPGGMAHGASRRAVHRGARDLPVQQGPVPARCDARPRHHRAERHHQDLLGDVRDLPAADAGRRRSTA